MQWTTDVLVECPTADRSELLDFPHSMRTQFVESLRQTLMCWDQLPHALLGLFAHEGEWVPYEAPCKQLAQSLIAIHEGLLIDGRSDQVHRVAHRFLARGSGLRAQMEAWINGTRGLQ